MSEGAFLLMWVLLFGLLLLVVTIVRLRRRSRSRSLSDTEMRPTGPWRDCPPRAGHLRCGRNRCRQRVGWRRVGR